MAEGLQTRVIAIASVSGGGKTTVVEKLKGRLPNAKALFFDDYDLEGPEDVMGWLNRGADNNEWNLNPLVKDLEELLNEPLDYIVLDFPFSYKHAQTAAYIDFSIFINTPLDVALARRIVRDFQADSAANIIANLEHYNLHGRQAYLEMLHTIKPTTDFIVDGSLPVDQIVKTIIENM